jgi:hypothetical protein
VRVALLACLVVVDVVVAGRNILGLYMVIWHHRVREGASPVITLERLRAHMLSRCVLMCVTCGMYRFK